VATVLNLTMVNLLFVSIQLLLVQEFYVMGFTCQIWITSVLILLLDICY